MGAFICWQKQPRQLLLPLGHCTGFMSARVRVRECCCLATPCWAAAPQPTNTKTKHAIQGAGHCSFTGPKCLAVHTRLHSLFALPFYAPARASERGLCLWERACAPRAHAHVRPHHFCRASLSLGRDYLPRAPGPAAAHAGLDGAAGMHVVCSPACLQRGCARVSYEQQQCCRCQQSCWRAASAVWRALSNGQEQQAAAERL
jgi:hypothetical protein